jgi:Phosphotransferase enzyme family
LNRPITIDETTEAALVAAARKELAYLEQFGQPPLPFRRERRDGYQYQEQSPSDHIENLNRYLLIASSLVPRDPALCHFCIRHPDLQPSNIVVSKSPNSNWQVVGLLDWQHASILPPFLLAGIPQRLQNYDDPISQSMTPPSLPENFDELDKTEQTEAEEVYRRRLVHYHYVKNTEEYNELHYVALTDPMGVLRRRLFDHASSPWEGETLALKVALIQATEKWETLTGGGAPCPVMFDAEDVRETMKLDELQRGADEALEVCQNVIGLMPEGWVPTQHYEEAMANSKQMKADALAAATSAEERAEILEHWPWDDMDEEKYM